MLSAPCQGSPFLRSSRLQHSPPEDELRGIREPLSGSSGRQDVLICLEEICWIEFLFELRQTLVV